MGFIISQQPTEMRRKLILQQVIMNRGRNVWPKILGTPVVSPEERVHVRDAGLSGSGVTQVSHIDLPCKGQHTLGIVRIMQLFLGQVLEVTLHRTEDFGNGARAESTLTEHIFRTRHSI